MLERFCTSTEVMLREPWPVGNRKTVRSCSFSDAQLPILRELGAGILRRKVAARRRPARGGPTARRSLVLRLPRRQRSGAHTSSAANWKQAVLLS
jgi:hypothetical protein